MDMLYNYIILGQFTLIDGFIFLLPVFFCQINVNRHKGTVFADHLTGTVLVGKLQALLIQEQGNLGTNGLLLAGYHGELRTTVTLPVYRLCSLFIGKSINMHLICYHECGIESQSKMTDNLILICLVLILCQEIRCAGKCNLVDILFHFICSHAKSVIDELQSLLIRVHQNLYLRFIFLRKCILTHHIQLLQLGDGIASVRNQFTEENIVVRIQPFFNNRENIVAVNGK